MADIAIFRINYKSDFILTLQSDAGWMTPFCIKFWTGAPSQAYFAGYDGTTYTHCAPVDGDPTKLSVQFDDHHLPIGDMKFQIGYHFTVADFPTSIEDEVINQAAVIIDNDGEQQQVMLDFNGETAPEIAFAMPAYANEAQRIANEQARIAAEEQRVSNEEGRISAEESRQENEQQRIHNEETRIAEFASLKAEAIAATGAANDAATFANEKAQLAADKAALAQTAATLANDKAQLAADKASLAQAAATLANDKAALAQQKADYAQAKAEYAQAQGDYAKAQSDIALADHERAETDHERAEADHDTATDDHTTATSDHTQAESDHTRAEADHTTAASDHTQASSDHSTATSDHTQAGQDHTRAESDHTTAAADHTRAESDHAAVEAYVDSLGAFDISAYHATGSVLAKYADLTAALGTNGANIPDELRKGGMSVKFVLSSDNKYVNFRYMEADATTDATFTNVANWQGVDDEPTAGSENLVQSGGVYDELSKKAYSDGYYGEMTVGSAENLVCDDVNNDGDIYRKTGGNDSVSTGIAQIEGIKGNTIVWNSYMAARNSADAYYGSTWKTNADGYVSCISGKTNSGTGGAGAIYGTLSFKADHYYYVYLDTKRINGFENLDFFAPLYNYQSQNLHAIQKATADKTRTYIVRQVLDKNTALSALFKYIVIDLTQIYGAGNEPTSTAQFEADYYKWFGKPLITEPNDTGSLRPTMIDGLKITGFNQYNPESGLLKAMIGEQYQITGTYTKVWESDIENAESTEYTYGNLFEGGTFYSVNGSYYYSPCPIVEYDNTALYKVGFYVVYENQIYKCNTAINTAEEFDPTHWNLIADVAAMVTEGIFVPMDITPDSNGIFTPSKFYVHVEGGNATDTCVHLVGDGSRNGEYEQYKENNVSIPVSTLTGKLNGEGESVVVFPDGMKRAGSVCDEIVIKNGKAAAIKRLGTVNLGDLDWDAYSSEASSTYPYGFSGSDIVGNGIYKNNNRVILTTNRKYEWVNGFKNNNGIIASPINSKVWITDSSFMGYTGEQVKAALDGIYLIYPLATPEEYVLDDFTLPISIQADALGTEEQTIPSGVASAPAQIGIKYAIDAVGFILNAPKNYISAESMDNFLSQLGTAMGGTWTKTWNESAGKWDFSFTQNVTPQDNND